MSMGDAAPSHGGGAFEPSARSAAEVQLRRARVSSLYASASTYALMVAIMPRSSLSRALVAPTLLARAGRRQQRRSCGRTSQERRWWWVLLLPNLAGVAAAAAADAEAGGEDGEDEDENYIVV